MEPNARWTCYVEITYMVSIYGTFLAIVIPGAILPMLWIEQVGSESLLARTKPIKRPAWRLASLFKLFGCTALKLGVKNFKQAKNWVGQTQIGSGGWN